MSDDKDNSELIKDFIELWQKQFPYEVLNMSSSDKMKQDYFNFIKQFNNNEKDRANTSDTNVNFNDDIHQLKLRINEFERKLLEIEKKLTS